MGENNGIRFPREFALLIKQLLYFDRYNRILAPQLRVFDDQVGGWVLAGARWCSLWVGGWGMCVGGGWVGWGWGWAGGGGGLHVL